MKKYILFLFLTLILVGTISAGTMTRTAPTTSSGNFQITYTATGTSGFWGASIVDVVTGGCKFPDGTNNYRSVILSTDGNTKTVIITAPSTGGCTFVGDYKFNSDAIIKFSDSNIILNNNTGSSNTTTGNINWSIWIILLVIGIIVVFIIFNKK